MAALAAVALTTCSSTPVPASSGDRVILQPEPSVGAFVVVAVDNHFHDIHPIDHTEISETRPFIVKNEGNNLHNFTVVGTAISMDIPPGEWLTWARLGDHLRPGSYTVICKYHLYAGMTGNFVVTL